MYVEGALYRNFDIFCSFHYMQNKVLHKHYTDLHNFQTYIGMQKEIEIVLFVLKEKLSNVNYLLKFRTPFVKM